MLTEILRQGVSLKVDGEQVTCWQALGVGLDAADVEELGVASLPEGKLMHAKRRGEGVPGLDQLGIWGRAWLPAERLNW